MLIHMHRFCLGLTAVHIHSDLCSVCSLQCYLLNSKVLKKEEPPMGFVLPPFQAAIGRQVFFFKFGNSIVVVSVSVAAPHVSSEQH